MAEPNLKRTLKHILETHPACEHEDNAGIKGISYDYRSDQLVLMFYGTTYIIETTNASKGDGE